MIDNKLYEYMAELLKRTPLDFIRYKYDEINWNGRLIGIVGPRGVGKSTMILQRIKLSKEGHHLYVSADNIYFSNHSLIDFAVECTALFQLFFSFLDSSGYAEAETTTMIYFYLHYFTFILITTLAFSGSLVIMRIRGCLARDFFRSVATAVTFIFTVSPG